ncbi:MAG: condensation domain-containing protein, partial [Parvularculaceae bacterium]
MADTALALVERLREQGVELRRAGDKLSLVAPEGVVTPALAAEIRTHKEKILDLLRAAQSIPSISRDKPLPLGVVQERLWAHAQMEPDSLQYNLPAAWRFKGPFDEAAFCAAFDGFMARHEVMRSRIDVADGLPRQSFAAPIVGALGVEDLSGLAPEMREDALARRIETLRVHQFDLGAGVPYVARLFRLHPFEHALFFMPHHLVWDGWCFDILLRELKELYLARVENRAATLPPLRAQYADYANWHRRRLDEGAWRPDLEYWERALANLPAPLNLPADLTRPALFSAEGDWTEFDIPEALLERIKAIAAGARATTFMTFLTLWAAFLARISGDLDIVVGAPIQARQHADLGDVVGCFVNTIFLRQEIAFDRSVRDLLKNARETCLAAYQRQEAPVEILVDRVARIRDPSRTPLAQAMFTHQHVARRPLDFGAAAISQIHVNPRMSPTDLMFAVMEGGSEARALIHHASGVFTRAQAERLKNAFETFLKNAVRQPDAPVGSLALIGEQERARLVAAMDRGEDLGTPVLEMILEADPEKAAITTSSGSMSYGQLAARSARLAQWLMVKGVRAGDIVGLMVPRDADMVALALGLWRCGAAYLPRDPAYPPQRLKYMV